MNKLVTPVTMALIHLQDSYCWCDFEEYYAELDPKSSTGIESQFGIHQPIQVVPQLPKLDDCILIESEKDEKVEEEEKEVIPLLPYETPED